MDFLEDSFGQLNQFLDQANFNLGELIANPYVSAFLLIFIIFYAGLAAPELPDFIAQLFDFTLFKIAILALILFVNNYNPAVAMMVAVAFFISLQTLSRQKMGDMAKYLTFMKQNGANGAEEAAAGEEEGAGAGEEEAGAVGPVKTYDIGMDDFNGDDQVSGLANRTSHYQGPQGMKHPVGYGGSVEGADLLY